RLGPLSLPEFSTLLTLEGGKALEGGNLLLAHRLGRAAVDFTPAYLPGYTLQARALLRESLTQAPKAGLLIFQGMTAALQDFPAVLHLLGTLAFILIIAASLTLLTYGIVLILRTAPFYHHLFKEMTGDFSPGARAALWGILICLTLIFHAGWGVVLWTLLAWIYLPRRERFWAGVLVFLLFFIPYASPYLSFLYRAGEDPLLRTLAAAQGGTVYFAPVPGEGGKGGPVEASTDDRLKTAEALRIGRLHRWEEARTAYQEILKEDPGSRIALVNLGNAAFYQERFDEAMEYYRTALRYHPDSAPAAFNLSQAYKEKLLFAEGEKSLEEALRVDRKQVEGWIEGAKMGRGFTVVYETIPQKEFWQTALRQARVRQEVGDHVSRAFFSLPLERLPIAGGGVVLVLILVSFRKGRTPMAYACPQCGKIVCARCTGSHFYGKVCRECLAREKAGVMAEPSSGKENRRVRALWAFLIPGSLLTFQGKILRGGIRSFLFFAALTGLSAHRLWMVPAYYHPTQGPGAIPGVNLIWLLLLAGVYFSVLLELKILRIKFKS
ncbi:MAG: tetratricopeptide repeat protein, partial [Nitrospirae bacterium]|nr:tetratricopeptide repeat protein [Nitrospirota bacterium]